MVISLIYENEKSPVIGICWAFFYFIRLCYGVEEIWDFRYVLGVHFFRFLNNLEK